MNTFELHKYGAGFVKIRSAGNTIDERRPGKELCTLEEQYFRFVFFEDLNFGWVISQTQHRKLKVMAEELDLPDFGLFFAGQTLSDVSVV